MDGLKSHQFPVCRWLQDLQFPVGIGTSSIVGPGGTYDTTGAGDDDFPDVTFVGNDDNNDCHQSPVEVGIIHMFKLDPEDTLVTEDQPMAKKLKVDNVGVVRTPRSCTKRVDYNETSKECVDDDKHVKRLNTKKDKKNI